MFDKCIPCDRLGQDCMPNLLLLSVPELIKWCFKRKQYIGWTVHEFAERSKVPEGTLNRLKQGDYQDCRYSTLRNMLAALVGGISGEFPCKEKLEQVLQQVEKMEALERENRELIERLKVADELHRNDIRIVRAEYQEQIDFLKEQLRAWQRKER